MAQSSLRRDTRTLHLKKYSKRLTNVPSISISQTCRNSKQSDRSEWHLPLFFTSHFKVIWWDFQSIFIFASLLSLFWSLSVLRFDGLILFQMLSMPPPSLLLWFWWRTNIKNSCAKKGTFCKWDRALMWTIQMKRADSSKKTTLMWHTWIAHRSCVINHKQHVSKIMYRTLDFGRGSLCTRWTPSTTLADNNKKPKWKMGWWMETLREKKTASAAKSRSLECAVESCCCFVSFFVFLFELE